MGEVGRIVLVTGFGLGLLFSACDDAPPAPKPLTCDEYVRLDIFDKRIAPLLEDGTRTACNECHLQGVDLGMYSPDGDECRTMACMVDSGIVDLDAPGSSKVLDWLERSDPKSPLITPAVLAEERAGMLQWIEYRAQCGRSDCLDVKDPCDKKDTEGSCDVPAYEDGLPAHGFEDQGDCSDRTLERAFNKLVYSWRGRCYPCHWDSYTSDPKEAPRWVVDDECNAGSLGSMRQVVDLGLIDRDKPAESLLLLKPLDERAGGVTHGGDAKFVDTKDGAYVDFKTWIDLYLGCTPG